MSTPRYLVFDTESVADGELVARLRYPGQGLSAMEAVGRYRAELVEKYENDFIPYTFQVPVAAAIVERMWLTGIADPRVDECRSLLESAPASGLEWARSELAMWLRRIDATVPADAVTEPYRLLFDGQFEAAAEAFHQLSTPYDAAPKAGWPSFCSRF